MLKCIYMVLFPHDPWLFQSTNLDAAFLAAKQPKVHLGAAPYTRCPRTCVERVELQLGLEQRAAQESRIYFLI